MTTLTDRACQLGSSINLRIEKHGDDDVPACDIPLGGLMLNHAELGALLNDPKAYTMLFHTDRGHPEPAFPQIQNLVLRDKRVGANVTIRIQTSGPAKSIELKDCKLKDLTLAPLSGGLTALAVKVQTSGDHVPMTIGVLAAHLNGHVSVEIGTGEAAKPIAQQGELPINRFKGDDDNEGFIEEPIENSKIGGKIQHAARKIAKRARRRINAH